MKVKQIANEFRIPGTIEYETDLTDIDDIIREFGRTNDTLLLYNDEGQLIAGARWPSGYRIYQYLQNPEDDQYYWYFKDYKPKK